MTSFLISILIPTYNAGKYLKRALDSIVKQDFYDYEVVISDNYSTDNTVDIVNDFRNKIDNLRFIRKHDQIGNPAEGVENALMNSAGKIVSMLGADDEFLDVAFKSVAEAFENNKELEWVYGETEFFDDRTNTMVKIRGIDSDNITCKKMLDNYDSVVSFIGSFFKRELFNTYGFLNYKDYLIANDYELMLRLLYHGVKPVKVNKRIARYHYTGKNYSAICTRSSKIKEREKMRNYYLSLIQRELLCL